MNTIPLSENVRKIEDGKYFVVVEATLSGDMNGPFVTLVSWAENDGAALRALDGNLEADTHPSSSTIPPLELLPRLAKPEYASIISRLENEGEVVLESGEYRIASDGVFLQKVVRSSTATYYFRSPETIAEEKPFAITHRLRSSGESVGGAV